MTRLPPWAVMSPMRAAGRFMMSTVKLPRAMTSGGPTHMHMSVTRAAGSMPTSTVTAQGGRTGPPTCGMGGTPGVTIGQTCMSVTRDCGIPIGVYPFEVLLTTSAPLLANPPNRALTCSGSDAAANITAADTSLAVMKYAFAFFSGSAVAGNASE